MSESLDTRIRAFIREHNITTARAWDDLHDLIATECVDARQRGLAARDAELATARAEVERLRELIKDYDQTLLHLRGDGKFDEPTYKFLKRRANAALAASREPEPAAEQTSDDEGVAPDDDSDLIPVRHIPGVGLVDAEAVEEHPAVLAGLSGRFPGEPNAAADGASDGSAGCPKCGHPWSEHTSPDGCLHAAYDDDESPCLCMRKPPPEPAQRGIPRTNDDGERRGNIHGKPPPEPDDADVAALKWWQDEGMHENECLDLIASVAALLRTREAAAKRRGVREGWEAAVKELRLALDRDVTAASWADWLDARKLEVE